MPMGGRGKTGRQADGATKGALHRGPPDGAAGQGGSGRELQLVGVTRASVEGLALVVHVARELQGNQGAPEHVAPGRAWSRARDVGVSGGGEASKAECSATRF